MVEDTVASAAVRAGVAAAANPAEAGVLAAGGALDAGSLSEVVLQHGVGNSVRRVVVPASVAAIGAAAGVMAIVGLVGGGTSTPAPTPTPTPTPTPMPSGVAFMYDPASKSAVGNGGNVTTWTDTVGGAVATQTSDSTTPHTFVANAIGGLPAVRLSGGAVLETTGTNTANTTTTSGTYSVVVVMANVLTAGAGQSNPTVLAIGTDTSGLLQASPTETGRYNQMYPCGDAGIRTVAASISSAGAVLGVNGGAFSDANNFASANGQITIGGWKNLSSGCCGRADILGIIGFNRAVTAADLRQIQRRYCDLAGQTYPGGSTARHVSFLGDSLMFGFLSGATDYLSGPGYTAARALNLPWGTFDMLAVPGSQWALDIQGKQMPQLGNIPAVTGTKNIVVAFEYANQDGAGASVVYTAARNWIDAMRGVSPLIEIVFATSTDKGDAAGVTNRSNRTAYNAYWDTAGNRTGIDAYVQFHLDPNIGVIGACPTGGAENAYWNPDGIHNKLAGYALIDNGPNGLRPAIAARLAA